MPLPYSYLEDRSSGNSSITFGESFEGTRVFTGPWESRYDFAYDYLFSNLSEVNGVVVENPGNSFPEMPISRCLSASFSGMLETGQDSNENITHGLCKITAEYGYVIGGPNNPTRLRQDGGLNEPTETIISGEQLETHIEVQTFPLSSFKDANGNYFKTNRDQVVPITIFDYSLTLPYVLNPRLAIMTFYTGTVNICPVITPAGLIAAPEKLRYDGPSAITKIMLGRENRVAWDMTHKFSYNEIGWNNVYKISDDETEIVKDALLPKVFVAQDLRRIFREPNQEGVAALARFENGNWGVDNQGNPVNADTFNDTPDIIPAAALQEFYNDEALDLKMIP